MGFFSKVIHIEDLQELENLQYTIEHKDDALQIFRIGFAKGRAYLSRSDIIKAVSVIVAVLFLVSVISYNFGASSVTERVEPTIYTDNAKETIDELISRYEKENNVKFYDYSRGKVQEECSVSPPSEWSAIVAKYGEEIKRKK